MSYTNSAVAADGVTDDTATLQAELTAVATTGGCLVLPPGQIKVTSNISVTGSQPFAVVGAGPAVTQIAMHGANFGWGACHYARWANFGVVAQEERSEGSLFAINEAYRASMDHVSISEGYQNLWLGNVVGATFHRLYLSGGTYFTEGRSGSANLVLDAVPGGVNNGLDFDGCYFEGGQTGQSNYEASVRINNVDGAWFRGGHIYGGHNVQVLVYAGPAVTAVSFHGVYVEHGPTWGMIFQNPTGHMDGITVNGCQFNNQPYPMALNGPAPSNCIITSNRGLKTIPAFPASVVSGNI